MSREIKFKVWNEDQKTYDYKFPYNSIGDFYVSSRGKVFSDFGNTIVPEVRQEAFVVEQYTGLKDKNGKEIYEGDIIQCHLSPISSTIFTGVVEFRPGCIMFKNFADGGAYAFNFLGAIEAVIGNIHENPELLGDKE